MTISARILQSLIIFFILISTSRAEDISTFTIHGKAMEKGTRKPLEGMTVKVIERSDVTTVTGKDGGFTLTVAGADEITIEASGEGYDKSEQAKITPSELKPGEVVKLYLLPVYSMTEVVVEADRNQDKTGKTVATGKELASVPGSAGDPLRGMQALPGITTSNDFSSNPAIRGTGPEDNAYYADLLPVAYLFHMGGLVSVFNADLVDDFNIYASSFGPEFTDVTGAIIDVKLRDPRTDRLGAKLNISTLEADLLIEGPVSETQSFYVGARRSYIDLLLSESDIDSEDGFEIRQFPQYSDYQAKYLWKLSPDSKLTFMANGAKDEMKFTLTDEADAVKKDPVLAGDFNFKLSFRSEGAVLSSGITPRVSNRLGLWHLFAYVVQDAAQVAHVFLRSDSYYIRDQLSIRAGDSHEILTGFEYGVAVLKIELDVPNVMPSEYDPNTQEPIYSDAERIYFYDRLSANGRSLFVKDRWNIFGPLTLVIGGRTSYGSYLQNSAYEPRMSAEYQATEGTLFTAGWGKYHQSPQGFQVIDQMGNRELEDIKADHYGLGMERKFSEGWKSKLDLYYKDLYDLVIPDEMKNYINGGSGKAYGAEMLIKKDRTENWSGWISATYSKTERRNDITGEEFPYSYDQPWVINLVYEWKFKPKWTFGAKWRYQSGAPYTPVLRGEDYTYEDKDGVQHTVKRPVFGELGSERLPSYHRLDVRIAREFVFDTSKMNVFFEIINAYNRKNISGYEYDENYDPATREPIEQLPIMPALGIQAEF